MKNSETKEYELVVGNRQVVSAFFIVVVLCALFFVLGYVVGRNAPHSANAQPETPAAPAQPQAQTPQAPAQAAPAAQTPDASAQAPADSAPKADAEPPPQPTTQAARETPPPPPMVQDPRESYWQVGAFKQASEAQPVLQTLRDGGMPTTLRTGTDGLVHVLVGPYRDTASLANARKDLETRFGIKDLVRK